MDMFFFLPVEHPGNDKPVIGNLLFTHGARPSCIGGGGITIGTAEYMGHTVGGPGIYRGFYPLPPLQHGAAERTGADRLRTGVGGRRPFPDGAGPAAAGKQKEEQQDNTESYGNKQQTDGKAGVLHTGNYTGNTGKSPALACSFYGFRIGLTHVRSVRSSNAHR